MIELLDSNVFGESSSGGSGGGLSYYCPVVDGVLQEGIVIAGDLVLSGFTDIGLGALSMVFKDSHLASVVFKDLEQASYFGAFEVFYNSTLEKASFPKLEKITSGCFQEAFTHTNLEILEFPKLKEIATLDAGLSAFAWAFSDTKLKNVEFPALEKLTGFMDFDKAFASCSVLESISFPKLNDVSGTKPFNKMLQNTTGVTLHFPANMENTIKALEEYSDNFGGTNVTVLFDL